MYGSVLRIDVRQWDSVLRPALQMRPQLRVVEFRLGSELRLRRIDETQPFEMTAEEAPVAA